MVKQTDTYMMTSTTSGKTREMGESKLNPRAETDAEYSTDRNVHNNLLSEAGETSVSFSDTQQ